MAVRVVWNIKLNQMKSVVSIVLNCERTDGRTDGWRMKSDNAVLTELGT